MITVTRTGTQRALADLTTLDSINLTRSLDSSNRSLFEQITAHLGPEARWCGRIDTDSSGVGECNSSAGPTGLGTAAPGQLLQSAQRVFNAERDPARSLATSPSVGAALALH
jgi:hypothetical protein